MLPPNKYTDLPPELFADVEEMVMAVADRRAKLDPSCSEARFLKHAGSYLEDVRSYLENAREAARDVDRERFNPL